MIECDVIIECPAQKREELPDYNPHTIRSRYPPSVEFTFCRVFFGSNFFTFHKKMFLSNWARNLKKMKFKNLLYFYLLGISNDVIRLKKLKHLFFFLNIVGSINNQPSHIFFLCTRKVQLALDIHGFAIQSFVYLL